MLPFLNTLYINSTSSPPISLTYDLHTLSQGHPQFTTKTIYTFTAPVEKGRKIFTCRLADPAPAMPAGFELDEYPDLKPDAYVLVDAETLVVLGKEYKYPLNVLDDYVPIMTADWQQYAQEVSLSDLKEDGNFLVYFEQIVQKDKDNKQITTPRGHSGAGLQKLNGKCRTGPRVPKANLGQPKKKRARRK